MYSITFLGRYSLLSWIRGELTFAMWLLKENPKRGAGVKYQPLNYKIKLQNIHKASFLCKKATFLQVNRL